MPVVHIPQLAALPGVRRSRPPLYRQRQATWNPPGDEVPSEAHDMNALEPAAGGGSESGSVRPQSL